MCDKELMVRLLAVERHAVALTARNTPDSAPCVVGTLVLGVLGTLKEALAGNSLEPLDSLAECFAGWVRARDGKGAVAAAYARAQQVGPSVN